MIKTSEDANKYYGLVNQYIDEYIDKWKIKPHSLKNYLLGNKSKMISFLERKGLKNINNIHIVLNDVIEDRVAISLDVVMTFENFNYQDSDEFKVLDIKQCLWKGINKADMEHEKVLADVFDVSLSQIDCVDSGKHFFNIDGGDMCVVYSEGEIQIIRENLKEYMFNKVSGYNVNVPYVDIDLNLGNFVDADKFNSYIDNVVSLENTKSVVCKMLDCEEHYSLVNNKNYFVGIHVRS